MEKASEPNLSNSRDLTLVVIAVLSIYSPVLSSIEVELQAVIWQIKQNNITNFFTTFYSI